MKRCGVAAAEKKCGWESASAISKSMCAAPALKKVSVASREEVPAMYKYKINFSGVAYVAAETEEDALENFFDGYVLSDTVEVQSAEVVEEY